MALTEGVRFFQTQKEESKQILAKYSRQNNEAYLEAAYEINAKLLDRVPYVTREGMEIQLGMRRAQAGSDAESRRRHRRLDRLGTGKGRLYRQALPAVTLALRKRTEAL